MNSDQKWVLIDTETNGISDPIFVVDLAVQRMKGWEPDGPPFQSLINQNVDIPAEVSRINGYTREILERDGKTARSVYSQLREYVGNLPMASYNLDFDWDRVLVPELKRLQLPLIGERGFCVLRLAQRLLDPVPAGNCKLQTLRQFYRLPERGAHSAYGDVLTVVDLLKKVLRPIALQRDLDTWTKLVNYTEEVWFPTRLSFGKFKGRSYKDARHDRQLFGWLEWLSTSKNERTASMGAWYLKKLEEPETAEPENIAAAAVDLNVSFEPRGEARTGIVIFQSIELDEIRYLVTAARERLADLEVIYARECNAISVTQSQLFSLLKNEYKRRDSLKLVVSYRRMYLRTLTTGSDEEAAEVCDEFERAQTESERQYEEAERLAEAQKSLTEDQQSELKDLFRKLVRLFHPDRHVNDPEMYKAYTRLTQEINAARDSGDIDKLREIANDPEGYARRIGLGDIDLSDEAELDKLKRLYESLQAQILEMLESLDLLRTDPKYELTQLAARRPNYLNEVADSYRRQLQDECFNLEKEAAELANEIEELTGCTISDQGI